MLARHRAAFAAPEESLPDYGRVRFRKEGEDHGWAPTTVVALQQAVKAATPETYAVVRGQERRAPARRPA